MERTEILELMAKLRLYGMRAAYDEVITTGIKRRHEPPRSFYTVVDLVNRLDNEARAYGPSRRHMAPNSPSISLLIPSVKYSVLGLPLLPPTPNTCVSSARKTISPG